MALTVLEFPTDRLVPRKDRIPSRGDPPCVISVGRSQTLLRMREDLIVSRSGLRVRSVTPEQAEMSAHSSGARLWIFCFSIENPKLVYLACTVRRYSERSRLLLIRGSRPPSFEEALFHRTIPNCDEPQDFLEAISALTV